MKVKEGRPKVCKDEHLKFLDNLKAQGTYNYFEAPERLRMAYPELTRTDAYSIHLYWRGLR